MERLSQLIIGIIAASLFLGWFIEPAFVIFGGIILFVIMLLYLGGAEDGNPIRTAIVAYRGIPDTPLVRRAMKPQNVQKEKSPRRNLIWLLFTSGAFLIGFGLLWMHALGQI
jgi:hypothetical protein